MPFKSDKQREYFFAKLNSLPKGSKEYNKWKKVVDKFVTHKTDESNTPLNEIFKSLTSLQEELTEQRKLTIKESNLMKVQNFIKKRKNNQ